MLSMKMYLISFITQTIITIHLEIAKSILNNKKKSLIYELLLIAVLSTVLTICKWL